MKKILLVGTVVLVLCGGVLLGQEVQKPYSYTFDKGVGTCVFTGVSLDQVWTATVKALMQGKDRVTSADKASGVISAECRPWDKPYLMSFFFEEIVPDVRVNFTFFSSASQPGLGGLVGKKSTQKFNENEEKDRFDKIAELLYGKIEK